MEAGAKAEAEANNREKTATDFMVYLSIGYSKPKRPEARPKQAKERRA
jgi:hypothetical protein